MKLPRLLPFRRARSKPSQTPPEADALAQARARALEQMRARRDAPQEAPPTVAPMPAPPALEPAPAPADETQPTAQPEVSPGPAEDPIAAAQAAVAEAEAQPGEGLDPDLMDIFRDAKQETEDGSLASEVEDVPIQDLLADLRTIGQRLGVKPSREPPPEPTRVTFAAPEPEPEGDPEAQDQQEIELPKVIQVTLPPTAAEDDPIEALGMPPEEPVADQDDPAEPDVDDLLIQAGHPGSQEQHEADTPVAPVSEAGTQQTAPVSDPAARRYILHALFFLLALGLAAGAGMRGAATGALAGDYGTRPTPAVLAYMRPPVVPETVRTSFETPSPTPSPTPEPTPSPTPSPTPAPNFLPMLPKIGGPAYFLYTVEYGDSLSSIAASNGICPDHILWNNPGRKEQDPLLVGQKLLLPGVKGIVHRVQPGDTLASIAAMYSTKPEKIVAVTSNHLAPGQEPTPGSRILVPDGIPPSALLRDEQAQELTHVPSPWGYVWPFFGPVTTYYGEERPGYTHLAIDIGGLGSYGAPVGAAAAGTVVEATHNDAALGNYVKIQHDDGSRTIYAHLSEIYVTSGQTVALAEPIGALGCTGHATGTHLHFELWIDGKPVDPLDYLP